MKSWQPQPRLRQKKWVDLDLTDREIFCSLPLGDVWKDANLVECYRYFRNSRHACIPEGWQAVIDNLDRELDHVCPQL